VEDGEPTDSRIEDSDRAPIHWADCRNAHGWGSLVLSLRKFFVAISVLAACAIAAAPAQAGSSDVSLQMDDGVSLAATLYLPDGTPPFGGWPAVMLFHGLGGTRASMAPIAEGFLVNQGYAVLAYDARGHGASGGLVTLDGPREMADLREAFAWLTSRPDVSDTQVGAMGFSLGGGAVLRAAVEGVPFKAIVPTITWTDLYKALAPQGWPKTGAIASFLQSVHTWDPTTYSIAQDALRNQNLDVVKPFSAQRSALPSLVGLKTPAFFIQGRRDYAFDIAQARAGYKAVAGPKRLYLGDLGHAPAANPVAEAPHYLTEARQWFDRFLKGLPNGIDTRPPIEVAADPWTGKTASFKTFPKTKVLSFPLKGAARITASDKVERTVKLPKRALEAFGSASVSVRLSSTSGWPHIVAVLSALTPGGGETVISEGAVLTSGLTGQSTRVTIRLLDDATLIPSGSRLRLTLASASTAQNIQNALYLDVGMPPSVNLTVGRATLRLPVLRKRVSR
jgi:predicted acyl esterase